jgi:hypothetical protein
LENLCNGDKEESGACLLFETGSLSARLKKIMRLSRYMQLSTKIEPQKTIVMSGRKCGSCCTSSNEYRFIASSSLWAC